MNSYIKHWYTNCAIVQDYLARREAAEEVGAALTHERQVLSGTEANVNCEWCIHELARHENAMETETP